MNLKLTRRALAQAAMLLPLAPKTGYPSLATNARSHHHPAGGFRNPWLVERKSDRGFAEFLRWQMGLGPDEEPAVPPTEVPDYKPVRIPPDMARIQSPPDPKAFQVTWIGHTTFLIQHAGLNILTDPMFGPRASPVSFAGPKRYTRPGLAFKDLPPIDLVLVSHNHYDHLDLGTVRRLGDKPHYAVPLKLAPWFANEGITNTREFDWWDEAGFAETVKIRAVPKQHFSGRQLVTDRNQTLWCGWSIESDHGTLYFAGDTGYGPFFKEIGEALGKVDVAIIPIGAYKPRWFMSPVHVDAAEAVQIHKDVGARRSIASHWGTFKLTTEPMAEPPLYLAAAREKAGLSEEDFLVMKFGETRAL